MNFERLEQHAVEERERVQRRVGELVDKVAHATPYYKVRKHFTGVSAMAFTVAFLFGYALGTTLRR